jgi:phage baseplate assembly protein W
MAQTPLGITLPVKRGSNGYFQQGFDIVTQAKSNLTNLLLTKKGERIMQPRFGCNIYEHLFAPITKNTESSIRGSIEEAVRTWLPYIVIQNVQVQPDEDRNKIYVTIAFSIPANANITDSIILAF